MNRMKSALSVFLTTLLAASPAFASGDHKGEHATDTKIAATAPMTDGEVKKIDKDNGKITIKHGEIKNLDMPGMTMVFRIQDPAMLDKVKVGDKINFAADKVKGNFTVTRIEAAK